MKRTLVILIVVALLIGITVYYAVSRNATHTDLQKATVTLDWTPNTNHTGLFVAQELGFFKEAGLDISIVQPGQNVTDQVVAAGHSEFGVSYQENVVMARAQGIPIVSIAAVLSRNTSGFASLKSANITQVADFDGKRYGSWDSPIELAMVRSVMEHAKADFSSVKVISGIYDFFSTIGKDADFLWIYYGWDGVAAEMKGIDINFIPLKDLHPALNFYTPVIIANEKVIAEDPELVTKFMTAVSRGYEFAIQNPDKAAEILLKHAPELDRELVIRSQQYLSQYFQGDSHKWGYQKPEVWQRFTDWTFENQLIEHNIESDKAFTNQFLP